jgi:hypothetical protein
MVRRRKGVGKEVKGQVEGEGEEGQAEVGEKEGMWGPEGGGSLDY